MQAVTDPTILAELNGGGSRKPVTDQDTLAQLNGGDDGFVSGTLKKGYNWLTGNVDVEYPDAGEFNSTGSTGGDLKAAAGFIATPNERGRANILQEINPDIEVQQDSDGNYMARLPGEDWSYINKPGLSMQDFNTVAAEIVKYLPAAKIGSSATGLGARAVATGAASGVTSVFEDKVADLLGSDRGIDPVKAGFSTVLGGLSEPAAATVSKIWRARPWKAGLINKAGELNDAGRAAAEAAGVDPSTVTPDVARALDDMAKKGLDFSDDAQAAIAGRAVDPKRIPATAGETAGNRAQMAAEAAMEAGGRGPQARAIMEDFRRKQGSSLVSASDDLAQGVDDAAEAAGSIGGALRDKADDAWTGVDAAYDELRKTPGAFNAKSFDTFTNRTLKKRFAFEGLDVENNAAVRHATSILNKATPRSSSSYPARSVTIKRIEVARQDLQKAMRAAKPEDKVAYGTAIGAVDAWYDKALRTALVKGDSAEIKKVVTAARSARKEYAQKFGKNDIRRAQGRMSDDAGAFVEKAVVGDLTNAELASKLFDKGLRSSGTSTRVVKRLETIFGRGSEEWELLEGGAIRNLLTAKGGAIRGVRLDQNGQPMLSNDAIATLARDVSNYVKTDYAKSLHGDNLKVLAGFADELQKFSRDKTIASTSGSDQGNLRAVFDLSQRMMRGVGLADLLTGGGVTTFAAGETMKSAGRTASRRAAEKATSSFALQIPDIPLVRQGIVAGGAAGGANLGSETR